MCLSSNENNEKNLELTKGKQNRVVKKVLSMQPLLLSMHRSVMHPLEHDKGP